MKNGMPSLLSILLSINSCPNCNAFKPFILSSNDDTSGFSGSVSISGDFNSVNCDGSSACNPSNIFGGFVSSSYIVDAGSCC